MYPYWNQTVVPDDFGNLIPGPSFGTKMWCIRNYYLNPEGWGY